MAFGQDGGSVLLMLIKGSYRRGARAVSSYYLMYRVCLG